MMKKKILIVDDELSICLLLENFLSKEYDVFRKLIFPFTFAISLITHNVLALHSVAIKIAFFTLGNGV